MVLFSIPAALVFQMDQAACLLLNSGLRGWAEKGVNQVSFHGEDVVVAHWRRTKTLFIDLGPVET